MTELEKILVILGIYQLIMNAKKLKKFEDKNFWQKYNKAILANFNGRFNPDIDFHTTTDIQIQDLAGIENASKLNKKNYKLEQMMESTKDFYLKFFKEKTIEDLYSSNSRKAQIKYSNTKAIVESLFKLTNQIINHDKDLVENLELILEQIDTLEKNILELQRKFSENQYDRKHIREFSSSLSELKLFSNNQLLKRNQFFLLKGKGGTGKTHCFLSVFCKLINENLPSIFITGNEFDLSSTIKNLNKNLKEHQYRSLETLLKDFENAIPENKISCIFIDAVNEEFVAGVWNKHLVNFINLLKQFPKIKLLISLRDGYEAQITNKLKDQFKQIDHNGFLLETENVVRYFFDIYKIPLPEVPLMGTEFSNPLYLKLYCETYFTREQTTGSLTFTWLLEQYIKVHVWNSIYKKYFNGIKNLSGSKILWNTITKEIAEKMIETKSRFVSINFYNKIFKSLDLPNSLTSEALLIDLINFNILSLQFRISNTGKKIRYITFAYDNLTNHLLARYIFTKYNKKSKSSRRKKAQLKIFGIQIEKSIGTFGLSLAEAIAVKLGDSRDKKEIFDYCKSTDQILLCQAFLNSLPLRENNEKSFDQIKKSPKRLHRFIIKLLKLDYYDIKESLAKNLFYILLKYNHPLSFQKFLNNFLLARKMYKRDFFLQYLFKSSYNQNLFNGLFNWTIKSIPGRQDDGKELQPIVDLLVWIQSSPQRYLRDKASKLLTLIFSKYPYFAEYCFDTYNNIDDLYILERLYASYYSAYLLSTKKMDFYALHNKILEFIRNQGFPVHLQTTISIISLFKESSIDPQFINKLIQDKFFTTSKIDLQFDKNFINQFIEKETKNNSEFGSIVTSLSDFSGDFYIYELRSHLADWKNIKNTSHKKLTNEINEFIQDLNFNQKEFLEKHIDNDLYSTIKKFNKLESNPLQNWSEDLLVKIKNESPDLFNMWQSHIKRTKEDTEGLEQFKIFFGSLSIHKQNTLTKISNKINAYKKAETVISTENAKYWMLHKIIKMGWNDNLHSDYESNCSYTGRGNHKEERIGKKYQWIALNSLIFEIGRRYILKERYGENFRSYDHHSLFETWEIRGFKDIDLTFNFVHESTYCEAKIEHWKEQINKPMPLVSNNEWLKSKELPELKDFVLIRESQDQEWISLSGYFPIVESNVNIFSDDQIRVKDFMYLTHSCIIDRLDLEQFIELSRERHFWNKWFPDKVELSSSLDLGEYYYSKFSQSKHKGFNYPDIDTIKDEKIPSSFIFTTTEISQDYNSLDCSFDKSINIQLPSPWLIEQLSLEHKFFDSRFYNSQNKLVTFDPLIWKFSDYTGLLIDRNELVKLLDKMDKTLIWIITAEKRLKNLARIDGDFHGCNQISILGWLDDHFNFNQEVKFDYLQPRIEKRPRIKGLKSESKKSSSFKFIIRSRVFKVT